MRLLRPAAAMDSLRKWFYKPKRDDRSLLAQFFFADEALNMVAAELDSFDGRENPERCSTLVNQLRHAQERVLNITGQIMDQFLGNERVPRGFRVKFPEEVLQDNLAGQLWFGAECLAAGSSIMHREEESTAMRPLARALTRTLETVRSLLREHCLRYNRYGSPPPHACTEILHESLKIFDRLFAEFELCYVSAMVPVKTPQEFEVQQLICVLFSETLQRARRIGLLTQDQVDDYDPALMFAIPRLAIVSGLLIFSNGPLSIDKSPELMSDMFRPFRTLLHKIRELLWTLDRRELYLLEKLLCTNEDIANIRSNVDISNEGSVPFNLDAGCYPDISEFVTRFYSDNSHCKDMLNQIGCEWGNIQNENLQMSTLQGCDEERNPLITDADYLPENVEIFSPILDGMLRLNEVVSPNDNNESPLEAFCDARLIVENGNFDKSSPDEKPRIEPTCISDEVLVTDAFHSQEENNVKLNIEYVDTDICDNINTKESDNDKSQENSTLSISKSERRNSNRSLGSSRKSSRNESISSSHASDYLTRNLSSNGLSMFDPLAGASFGTVNINPTASDNNVLLPDQNLVSNLSEQVSEITDKLTSITLGDGENASENNMNISHIDPSIVNLLNDQVSGQIFSFSSNDVSNLVSSGIDPEFSNVSNNVTYSPSRTDKVMSQTSMPSTSNGYLIRNAISQEPAIMASLSTNNSGMYNDESILNPINNPLLMGQTSNYMNMESDLFTDSFSVANANLSCLLLTNEEFHSTFLTQGIDQNSEDHDTPIPQDLTFTFAQCDDSTYFSANDETLSPNQVPSTSQNNTSEKAQFLVGYESDSNDQTPADSGICTENTSLDRSPDSETKDIDAKTGNKPNSNYQLNKTKNNAEESKDNFSTNNSTEFDSKNQVDLSSTPNNENVSECDNANFEINSFCLNYCEDTESNQKNEAGPSHRDIQEPAFVQTQKFNTAKISDASSSFSPLLDENSDIDNHPDSYDNINNNKCDSNICNDNLSNNNEIEIPTTPSREDSSDKSQNAIDESQNNPSVVTDDIQTSANETHFGTSQISEQSSSTNSTGVVVQRKLRKTSPKNKKKSGKSRFSSVFHQSEPKIPWSPGRVVLHNRSYVENKTPMRLNLEQLVDDCAGGSCSSQSSATSSFHSDWADDEEIALALQAQEFASRHQTRAKFRSSEDLIHRLFVCIAGVADQLQTNFASDLRNILKSVFLMNQTPEIEPEKVEENSEGANNENEAEESPSSSNKNRKNSAIEYEVSGSEVMTNGDSFDSIHSAEEVYADNSPPSQRSHQSSRLSDSNDDENAQNDLNERRNSQTELNSNEQTSEMQASSQRNTITPILSESKQNSESNEVLNDSSQSSFRDSEKSPRNYVTCRERRQIAHTSRSARSSNSSLNSNNSENHHSPDCDNSPVNRQSYANDHNYINEQLSNQNAAEDNCIRDRGLRTQTISTGIERAPEWVPDIAAPDCMRCGVHFTAFRRRHHCRNCGKVFCASCSANSIPLPRFGQLKPVRVCEECFQLLAKKACASRQINSNSARQTSYTHR